MFSSLLSHRPLNTHLFVQFSSCSVQFVTNSHDDATLSMGGSPYVHRTAYRTHKTRDILLHVQPYEHTTCLSIPNPNSTSLYVYHTRVASTYRRAPPYALLPPSSLTTVMPKCWRVSSFTSSGSSLCARGLASAAGVNSVWRLAASPLIDAIAVRDVVDDLVDDVVSNMMEYEPIQGAPGECIGCGAVAAAFSQCLSCGAPVEPNDNSWHYSFGWVDGWP